jgi:hypothetical protein
VLAEQVEQCRFQRRHRMDGGAQVEGLLAAAAGVAVGEALLHRAQHRVDVAHALPHHQAGGVLQRLADLLAAGHLAHAGAAGAVGQHDQVAGEVRPVRAGQVEQHAVAARHGDRLQADDGGGVTRRGGVDRNGHGRRASGRMSKNT